MDEALVNFSIKMPSRFKKLNTKCIANKAFNKTVKNEAIFILEKTQTRKKFIFF